MRTSKKEKQYRFEIGITFAAGITINILLAFLAYCFNLPLYLDTAGTIFVAALCGATSGMIVAVITNILCSFFNPVSIYFVLISVLIAIVSARFFRKGEPVSKRRIPLFVLVLALIGGVLGGVFQWVLLGGPQLSDVVYVSRLITNSDGGSYYVISVLINFLLNILDKTITAGLPLLVMHFLPAGFKEAGWIFGWQQKPLSDDEVSVLREAQRKNRHSLRSRTTLLLSLAAIILTVTVVWISMNLYFEKEKAEYIEEARNAAKFAAEMVDPNKIDSYRQTGYEMPGYYDTRQELERIRRYETSVKHLYVVQIRSEGCYYVFDLEEEGKMFQPGQMAEYEDAFLPYVPALLAGEEIEPIESAQNIWGSIITVYWPIRNASGLTVGYVGADAPLNYLSGYIQSFLLKVLLVFSGFFVLVVGVGLRLSRTFLVYPIGSMAGFAERFTSAGNEQDVLDANVKKIRALNIRTSDEVEALYQAICRMAAGTAEQMRDIRHYAEATAQMQNGLIITMANMVEDRDSDTGAHVQKTAAYVRIILQGLKRKGYYAEKITPKYMSDVEMSAPLHDVGKIHIPDQVLNKPGKLTDEEYEIMKKHTIFGKEIMERAIDTVNGENYLKEARNMAAYHHERWDGKGYPEGLHGEVIPLSARVMAVADVFDALSSRRVYKPAFPLEKALEILEEGAGSQFDPKCIEVFMESLDEIKRVLRKYQNA